MKIKHYTTIAALSVIVTAPVVMAEPAAGDREIVIAGSGLSDNGFDNTTFGATVSYGQFTTDAFEWGVRQTLGISDTQAGGTDLSGATIGFADYHFNNGQWQPFVGGSLGAVYGESGGFIIGPEVGVKYYVKPKTFIIGQASYQFDVGEDIGDGSTFYTLGMGFNF